MEYNDTAQLQIGADTNLFGRLQMLNDRQARLQPLTQKTAGDRFGTPTLARLYYFCGPRLMMAPASVVAAPDGQLDLSFTGAHGVVERRYCERVTCDLSVSYRAVRSSNTFSAWNAGIAHNISAGGIGLWVEKDPPASGLLDIHIFLPVLPEDLEMEALFSFDPVVEGSKRQPGSGRGVARPGKSNAIGRIPGKMQLPPIRVQGQVRHMRRTPNGPIYLGMRFTAVTPTLYWKLSQLVQSLSRAPETSLSD